MSSELVPTNPELAAAQSVDSVRPCSSMVGRLGIGLIRLYRLTISPLLGPRCRFYPSCSHYAEQSIGRFGLVRGGWLALKRLLRCGPWHPGGVDEVPQFQAAATEQRSHGKVL